ncbi:hypothetical protein HYH03_005430 [Edaphochlamys debaryana]|uniref:Uncharacterized protein n=1 Tax=Edaphochlamys debaryana TaxID=47281 RepID=A0A835YFE9_9CHLO|nr:hypothetical protein HYH03_005430 [Edaphochlamys debaryana]|eukprot:KAG2496609.1 hypothetical protein HYH03_005430 [Edaphochlamys debaryana]
MGVTDDHVLCASGVVLAGLGLGTALAATQPAFDKLILANGTKSAWGNVGPAFVGVTVGSLAARDIALACNKDAVTKTKKNALKIVGVTHGLWAGWSMANVANKDFKQIGGSAVAGVHAGLSVMALLRGFKKD